MAKKKWPAKRRRRPGKKVAVHKHIAGKCEFCDGIVAIMRETLVDQMTALLDETQTTKIAAMIESRASRDDIVLALIEELRKSQAKKDAKRG